MKNLMLAVLVILVVAGSSAMAGKVNLPIGVDAVTAYQMNAVNWINITVYKGSVCKQGWTFQYNRMVDGTLSTAIEGQLPAMWQFFFQRYPGTPSGTFVIRVHAYQKDEVVPMDDRGSEIFFRGPTFSFEFVNGKWQAPAKASQFPSETEIALARNKQPAIDFSLVGIKAPEVRWMEIQYLYDGEVTSSQLTRNGFDPSCPDSQRFGNGWSYILAGQLSGDYLAMDRSWDTRPDLLGQRIVLWYDEGRLVGDSWDVDTGVSTPIGYDPNQPTPNSMKMELGYGSRSASITLRGVPQGVYTLEKFSVGEKSNGFVGLSEADEYGDVRWNVGTAGQFGLFRARPAFQTELQGVYLREDNGFLLVTLAGAVPGNAYTLLGGENIVSPITNVVGTVRASQGGLAIWRVTKSDPQKFFRTRPATPDETVALSVRRLGL